MLQVRSIYCIAVTAERRGRIFSVSSLYLGRGFNHGLFFAFQGLLRPVNRPSTTVSEGWMSPGSISGNPLSSR